MANPSPGLKSHPDHRITLSRDGAHVRVTFNGAVVADTTNAITLREASYPPVLYVPLSDVDAALLTSSERSTHCPFKGDARYWSISAGGATAENAVWAYPDPYDEMSEIAGHVAFYADKVTIETLEEAAG